ncbi:MAG: effector binding domain-containing protein [Caldilineaceae bacterium]
MSDLSITIQHGFSHYFRDFLHRVQTLTSDLSEEEFWHNPHPYGNSIGHLVLHITGNLNYYIGAQLAATGYVRDRTREFTESTPPTKAEALTQLAGTITTVIAVLEQQQATDWSASYSADGVDDVHDRFNIFLRCAVHFHQHIGHMSYTKDELRRQLTQPVQPQPRIVMLSEKKLIGQRMVMSLANNKTGELWRSFIPRRREIRHNVTADLLSLQVYDQPVDWHNLQQEFEKWAAVEVSTCDTMPDGMAAFTLPGGLYAVFPYKGSSTDTQIFQYIFGTWLPNSDYMLDNRPHFEVLGEKYKNADPNSEEDIWIPITPKSRR